MTKMTKRFTAVLAAAIMTLSALSVTAYAGVNGYGCSAPVYVFYSAALMDYFLTASESEKNSLDYDWWNGTGTYEYCGILGYAENYASCGNVPVYRFWNNDTADHFYTVSETEKQQLENDYYSGADGYRYEGIAFYVPVYGYTPVYRFFDVARFSHMYVLDQTTADQLAAAYQNGTGTCRYEGVAWYW